MTMLKGGARDKDLMTSSSSHPSHPLSLITLFHVLLRAGNDRIPNGHDNTNIAALHASIALCITLQVNPDARRPGRAPLSTAPYPLDWTR